MSKDTYLPCAPPGAETPGRDVLAKNIICEVFGVSPSIYDKGVEGARIMGVDYTAENNELGAVGIVVAIDREDADGWYIPADSLARSGYLDRQYIVPARMAGNKVRLPGWTSTSWLNKTIIPDYEGDDLDSGITVSKQAFMPLEILMRDLRWEEACV